MAKFVQHRFQGRSQGESGQSGKGGEQGLFWSSGQMLFDFEGSAAQGADVSTPMTGDTAPTQALCGDDPVATDAAGDGNASLDSALFLPPAVCASGPPLDVADGHSERLPHVSELALWFAGLLERDPSAEFDNHAMAQLAREVFGSAAGYARDTYDAAEAGMNLFLDRVGLDLSDIPQAMETLLALQARMPRQNRRDETQVELQQFSTPPAEALLVVTAAGLRVGMTVLEPSAGTGSIAILARLAGANVETNEIDQRRRTLLLIQGFTPTAFDAERLDNLLPADKFYDAVVMNPPFSATGGRVRGHSTEFGARHVEQALLRLKPGGRLVAIVGCGMALDRPAFRTWWADIQQRYRVRANLGMDGSVYSKFGTSFDNQIIVIDNNGVTASESEIITGSSLGLQEAYALLKGLSQEDICARIRGYGSAAGRQRITDGVPVRPGSWDGPGVGADRVLAGGRGRGHSLGSRRTGDNGTVAHVEPLGAGPPASRGADDDPRTESGTFTRRDDA